MSKICVVILADTETHGDMARVTNALHMAKEFKESDEDELELIFDGAGTKWIDELSNEDHSLHGLWKQLKGDEVSACEFCADAFEMEDEVEESNVESSGDFKGHPSFKKLVDQGYQIVTF